MREREVQEIETTEAQRDANERREIAKQAQKRRVMDTLSDENPLICRGMD